MYALAVAPRANFTRDIEIPFLRDRVAPMAHVGAAAPSFTERAKDPMFILFAGLGAAGLYMLFTGSAILGGAASAISAFYFGREFSQ